MSKCRDDIHFFKHGLYYYAICIMYPDDEKHEFYADNEQVKIMPRPIFILTKSFSLKRAKNRLHRKIRKIYLKGARNEHKN